MPQGSLHFTSSSNSIGIVIGNILFPYFSTIQETNLDELGYKGSGTEQQNASVFVRVSVLSKSSNYCHAMMLL